MWYICDLSLGSKPQNYTDWYVWGKANYFTHVEEEKEEEEEGLPGDSEEEEEGIVDVQIGFGFPLLFLPMKSVPRDTKKAKFLFEHPTFLFPHHVPQIKRLIFLKKAPPEGGKQL